MSKRVGIALGGGGAKGLAHIPMLQVLDDLGIRPHMIAGTSVGAIIGVLYASGMSATKIRTEIDKVTSGPQNLKEVLVARQLPGWLRVIEFEVGRSSVLKVDQMLRRLQETIGVSTFEDLDIPFQVVAADFWGREQAVFNSGPVIPAVAASFALPGIFSPVLLDGRVFIDGGSVNPLPFDLLQDECEIVVAVDVLGQRIPGHDIMPTYSEALFNAFQIAESAIVNAKIDARPPTILIRPEILNVRVLDFDQAESVYSQSESERQRLEQELRTALTEN